jgi:RecB family exonuclease
MNRRHPPVAAQVHALCQTHPLCPKVVFVPRTQVGQAIEQSVARRGGFSERVENEKTRDNGLPGGIGAWGGLSCLLPRHYAARLAARRILTSGRRELRPVGQRFLAARLTDALDAAPGDEAFAGLPGPAHFAGSVAQTVGTLRENGTSPSRLRAAVEAASREGGGPSSPVAGVVAQCYAAYEEALEDEQLYDDADVLGWGCEALEGEPPAEAAETVFAVIGEAELSDCETDFLHALRATGRAFYRIGADGSPSDAVPERFAAARFSEASLPAEAPGGHVQTAQSTGGVEVTGVCRAVGAGNEVRAAFQEILAAGHLFDDVEIALAQRSPYQGLVADVAEEAAIEVTFSTGRPALQTRTGQALIGLYDWIGEGFDATLLIRLLRSRLIRAERFDSEVSSTALATWLAGRRYEPGRAGYARAFALAEEDLQGEISRLAGKDLDTKREEQRLHQVQQARGVVTALLDLAPQGEASVAGIAHMSQRFLERFGPIDAPDGVPEEERSLEEAARRVLYQKLDNLRALPVTYEASPQRLAGMLREDLERQFVQSERPRAGAVHVVPLERAAFSGRRHLYVLGLGGQARTSLQTESAVNREVEALVGPEDASDSSAEAQQDPAGAEQWLARRALQRHAGPTHLYASTYDVESGDEQFPAALFLQAEDRLEQEGALPGGAPLACFLPDPVGATAEDSAEDGPWLLDERSAWLAAHADGRGSSNERREAPSARAAVCERYPWTKAVAAARAAQAAEEYTAHDGMIDGAPAMEAPFPGLDFTAGDYDGPPLSAGRLETFAETPYLYFLKYLLNVRPLDEPALDEGGWLDPLRRGSILHDTFERFMKNRADENAPVRREEEEALLGALDEALDEAKRRLAPPSERVEAAARRHLEADARVFLRAEAEAAEAENAAPWAHELGFGYGPRRAQEDDLDETTVAIEGNELRLRGRIDRVDRSGDGALSVWDYKTGSAKSYDQSEPLAEGCRLQWALYAYVLSAATGEEVASSGYFFTSAKEMGIRLSNTPVRYRQDVGDVVARLGAMARAGAFPMNPKAHDLAAWKWRGYDALFPDLKERTDELKCKKDQYPQDKPAPLFL